MEETGEIISYLATSDPMVLALLVALAGIALGCMALWVLLRLTARGGDK
jgi:hypothetical protein